MSIFRSFVQAFWQLVAAIVTKEAVKTWLIRQAQKRPYFHLNGYMNRWWLIPEELVLFDRTLSLRGRNFHLRLAIPLPVAVRIHHILRADADLVLHDHPWSYRTIILDGWYIEENVFGEVKLCQKGSTRAAAAETFHRIDEVSDGGVWTMFFMYGRRSNRWGFMIQTGIGPRKIFWRDYESANNRIDPTPDGGV
jgi:hypothetical protein